MRGVACWFCVEIAFCTKFDKMRFYFVQNYIFLYKMEFYLLQNA